MALGYSITSSSTYDGRTMTLSCHQTPDIANNRSIINWTLSTQGGTDGYSYSTGPTTVTINGTQVYYKGRTAWDTHTFPAKAGSTSGSLVVYHNSDGSKAISVSLQTAIYYGSASVKTNSGTWTLDSIPRGATITAAPNFNDEENPTITYSNPAGSAVSSIEACISFDGSKDDIAYRAVSISGTSYTFKLTDAERNILRNGTKTSNSRTVYFYIRTTIAGATYTNRLAKTLTIINAEPTLSPSAMISTSSNTYSLTGSQTTFIRGYTDVTVASGAAALKGATIVSQKITCGGKSITTGSGTINAVDSGTFTFTVVDSRGNTKTQTLTRTLINYINLSCNLNPVMSVDGVAKLNIAGNVFNDTFGVERNTLAIQYRYKELGGEWGSWLGGGTGQKDGHTYTTNTTVSGLSYKKRYVFQARAYDKLVTVTTGEVVVSTPPIFDWGENDFNFNVPVSISGEPIADFVVEQGTSGNWSYRKWNSGIAECWARIAVNTAVQTQWGGLYVSGALSATNLAFPFTFTAIPMVNVNLSGSGSGAFLLASGSGSSSTTNTGIYEIARGNTAAAANYAINYDVKGRWK